ncbi:MAG: nitrite reductase small subunit NirD [Tepidimonas sp.]|uniref:nitrite reductase small subunit NirD n=1 Tax=Tepidimonas sp. TaxID=2002775 RepID=UPI00298EDD1D|nr:nitrite reductase small subunit NirD [Tepidimonas sp.]MCS6811842.1 nitrite reductase small subunit NirD [Tepidimonas sp.]MDW8335651.1 nitrite reductase small subunit NirD [Tepidimonas sp.]
MSTPHSAPWVRICAVDDIPPLGARRVARPHGMDVALFRTADDRIFALLDRCPHKGGPLSEGMVFDHRVACPLHNWTIGLVDGQAAAPDEGCTPVFDVRVIDGEVWLRADQLAHHALDLDRPRAGPCSRAAAPAATLRANHGSPTCPPSQPVVTP